MSMNQHFTILLKIRYKYKGKMPIMHKNGLIIIQSILY